MKRLRAVSSLSEAVLSRQVTSRGSRQLLPALTKAHSSHPTTVGPSYNRQVGLASGLPSGLRHASTSAPSEELRKTPLYDIHIAHGGKMVPFGGFHMPVQYSSLGVSASHNFTRTHSSLFDVSHMVQHQFFGPGAIAFLERITPASISELDTHKSGLSTLLWPQTGGIVDDTIITRLAPELFYVVTNAGCREKDLKYFTEELEAFKKAGGDKVEWTVLEDWGLVALQGPLAEEILTESLAEPTETNLKELYFGESTYLKLRLPGRRTSSALHVSRGGYTGEDGFEISIPPNEAATVTEALLKIGRPERLQLAGLGARDSLRLEAGMCLYGHDLDDTTTPVEASLSWVIGKHRRSEGGFHGSDIILSQLTPKSKGGSGVDRRRVGLTVAGAPAREGADIVNSEGRVIGKITSGCPSPTLGKNIAMGYIQDGFHKSGTAVEVLVRGKKRAAEVTKMPFVPSKYWKAPA